MIKCKMLQQSITQVMDKHRQLQVQQENIATVFVKFYQELLETKEVNRVEAIHRKGVH